MRLIFILRRSLFGIILISIFLKNFFHWGVWESSIASNQKKSVCESDGEESDDLRIVPYAEFNDRYNQRDVMARKNMRDLVDSDANKVTKVFSTLF